MGLTGVAKVSPNPEINLLQWPPFPGSTSQAELSSGAVPPARILWGPGPPSQRALPTRGEMHHPSVSSGHSQLSTGAVPWPGWCAKPAEEQSSHHAGLGACPGTGAPLGMASLHQLRARDVAVRCSWKQETADKSGDCEEPGLCVRHDPRLLIFSFNRTYFYSSSVGKKKSKLFFLK